MWMTSTSLVDAWILARHNAMEISDTRFHQDMDRLIEVLEQVLNASNSRYAIASKGTGSAA
jgi:hypothetical protein